MVRGPCGSVRNEWVSCPWILSVDSGTTVPSPRKKERNKVHFERLWEHVNSTKLLLLQAHKKSLTPPKGMALPTSNKQGGRAAKSHSHAQPKPRRGTPTGTQKQTKHRVRHHRSPLPDGHWTAGVYGLLKEAEGAETKTAPTRRIPPLQQKPVSHPILEPDARTRRPTEHPAPNI